MSKLAYEITQKLIPIKKDLPSRRNGSRIKKVLFLVCHDTGNLDVPANNYYRNYINNPNVSASAHIFVDDKEIIEVIPSFVNPEKAWHVLYDRPLDNQLFGDDANDCAIGVELCWFTDKERSKKAYEKYVWVLAYLCKYHGLNPKTDIVGHEILDPGRKIDPSNGLKYSGHTYQDLLNDVVKEYNTMVGDIMVDKSFVHKKIITASALNIREFPNADAKTKIFGTFKKDDVVYITGQIGDWYRTSFNEKDVYIHSAYTKDYVESDYKSEIDKLKKINEELINKINNAKKALG